MEFNVFDFFTCLFSGLGLVSIIVLIIQIRVQINADRDCHEERRREKTVDVLFNWVLSPQKETRYAEKIVELLNLEQCRKLYMNEPFYVSLEIKNMLCHICPESKKTCDECLNKINENNEYELNGLQLTELRWYVVSYLNMLETVMVAWSQGIVDKETIESQFSYLYNPLDNKTALENFRKVAGNGNSYPSLNKFYDIISKSKKAEEKSEIGKKDKKTKIVR